MKEFIQKSSDEVAIVVYDSPLPPKYFRLTKRFIKTLFIVIPVFLLSVSLLLIFWGLGFRLKYTPAPTLPEVLSESETKILALENELQNLKESQQILTEKIASGSATETSREINLLLIKKPYGMQDLTQSKRVSLDQIEFSQAQNKSKLKFQIINANSEQRVTGNILVFMLSESGILGYPTEINSSLLGGVKYSMGESFAVSRLRPTEATFNLQSSREVRFVIYIFNREGDLLLVKETEPFQTGNNS